MYKMSFRGRNESDELNVFEAAQYFSRDTNEIPSASFAHKMIGEDRQSAARRMSQDVPPLMMMRHSVLPLQMEKKMEGKKHKQPSSPGGKLAQFLNSLFNQTSSKKKKSKSSAQSVKESEEESTGYRRKRRSSISFFHTIITNTADSKPMYSSSSSGFRTPPPAPYARHPTKRNTDYAFSDDKVRFSNGILEKNKNCNLGYSNGSRRNLPDHNFLSEEEEFRIINDFDDVADSDSSSDLFDLPNHDLDYYSSGLPVYESTHMNSIKRGAPISSSAVSY